ncbi:MAG: HemK/PrmC family methyltransferase [Clostridia bacterium]|nr:HemK/PrmC family methyltransferase [Clostridia bacterium]
MHLSDLSADALAVTGINAEALAAKVQLHHGDMFAPLEGERFHVLVSNPPYIPAEDCRQLQAEVLREPMTALDGGEDGYDFYRTIAKEAPRHLLPGGALFLEIGWDQAEGVCRLLREAGMVQVTSHQDYNGISRMVEAHMAD